MEALPSVHCSQQYVSFLFISRLSPPCWRTHWGSHWPTFISCLSSQNWAGSHGDCVGHGSACESVKRTQPLRVLRSRMCISCNQVHRTSIGPRPTKQFVIKDDVTLPLPGAMASFGLFPQYLGCNSYHGHFGVLRWLVEICMRPKGVSQTVRDFAASPVGHSNSLCV